MNQRKYRILQISGTGEGGTWFISQVLGLTKLGHAVRVVVPSEGSVSSELRSRNVPVDVIPFRGYKPRQTVQALKAVLQIRRIAQAHRAEIVHAHLLKASLVARLSTLGLQAKMISQIPGVVHLEIPVLRFIERATIRFDDLTLVSSSRFRPIFERLGAKMVRVNHYGMDTSAFIERHSAVDAHRKNSEAEGEINAVMVAHMYPTNLKAFRYVGVKGHEVFIDSIGHVLKQRPDVKFTIVGDAFAGGVKYRRRLEERASSVGASVRFAGSSSDVVPFFASAHLAVNPSMSESASYTAMEASLAELPVVVTDVGGLTDTVIDGHTGLVVDPNDARGLANAILSLVNDPALSRKLGREGRRHVSAKFSLESTVLSLVRSYTELLSEAHR